MKLSFSIVIFFSVLATCTASLAQSDRQGDPPPPSNEYFLRTWVEYNSPSGKYKIKFPETPREKVGDFRTIKLSFLDDQLVMIELEFGKNVKPERLRNIFGVEFAIVGGPSDLPDKPGQYPPPFYATYYPDSFTLVGISDQAFMWANCSASAGVPTGVDRVRLVTRTLEKK